MTKEGLQQRNLILGHRKAPGLYVEVDPNTGRVLTSTVVLQEMAARIAEAGGRPELAEDLRKLRLDEPSRRFADKALKAQRAGFPYVCTRCACGLMERNEEHECSKEFVR
jgi:hypothetical protein